MSNKLTEHYQCVKCLFMWSGEKGPQYFNRTPDNPAGSACPKCDSLYVVWLNYDAK